MAVVLETFFQRVEDFRSPPPRVAQRRRADRHDHEFLEIDRIVGVGAAIDDVHHRHRQNMRIRAADISIERQARRGRGGLRHGERNTEDRIGTDASLVRRSVELDHGVIDGDLVLGFHAADRFEQFAVDRLHRALDALAQITLTAVAQFDRFMCAGRRAGRDSSAAHRAVFQKDVDLDGGVAAAVKDFAADDIDDGSHEALPGWIGEKPAAVLANADENAIGRSANCRSPVVAPYQTDGAPICCALQTETAPPWGGAASSFDPAA